MKRERGFIELSMMAWGAIAAALVIVGLALGLKIQTERLRAVQAEYGQFRGGVEALGTAAAEAAVKQEKADKKRKDDSDAENARTIAGLNATVRRLRDSRAGSSFVPGPTADARRPDLACFDRPELERTLRAFDLDVQGIVDEGSATTVDLDTAKRWAQP